MVEQKEIKLDTTWEAREQEENTSQILFLFISIS